MTGGTVSDGYARGRQGRKLYKAGALIDLQAAELDYCEHKDFIHPGYAFTGTVWKTAGCVRRRMQSARGK